MNIVVLHGPNLNLLGERPGDERGKTLEDLNTLLRTKAAAYGVEVRIFQSNHEGELIDRLHAERRWAQGVIINPGALAHSSYVLRDALEAISLPAIEVHLSDIRRRESWRRKSVVKAVCAAQVVGKGFDSYVVALQRFATGDLGGKRKGARARAKPAAEEKAKPKASAKTIGRRAAAPAPIPEKKTLGRREAEAAAARPVAVSVITRQLVRQKIADRLSGKLTPSGLATWARTQWVEVQRGAPAESGQRELLEDSLQSLVLSTVPASRLSDDQLVELMTQLDG